LFNKYMAVCMGRGLKEVEKKLFGSHSFTEPLMQTLT